MRKFNRGNWPQLLVDNWKEIGENYIKRREANPAYSFVWPQINNQKVNQVILPALARQTQDHCSYCDNYPSKLGDETIDHFKPKTDTAYYHLVANWENLYLACKHCQDAKGTKYSDEILRPDDPGYNFLHYFIYDFNEHTLNPNPAASGQNQAKAEVTIKVFQLNHPALSKTRKRNLTCYRSGEYLENELGFRFMFQFV